MPEEGETWGREKALLLNNSGSPAVRHSLQDLLFKLFIEIAQVFKQISCEDSKALS